MIKKAVIPAAGLGSRFYPITKCFPKEMLPLHTKPVIHYVIEEAINSGIEDIVIVTRKGKTVIEDYIDLIPEFNTRHIYYVRQPEPLGLGDAILQTEGFIDDDQFAVLLGDDIIETNSKLPHIKELMNLVGTTTESIVSIEKMPKDQISKYGVVEFGNNYLNYATSIDTTKPPREIRYHSINSITEKPSKENVKSDYAVIGRYILVPEIFKYLKQSKPSVNNEIQLTDAFDRMIKDGWTTYGLELDGLRYDVGSPEGYMSYLKQL
jgi:UTP--glucose-1-phosphate uridylyltransferase